MQDLAGLTGDIPAGPAGAEPAAEPAGTPARTLAIAARRSGICLLIAFALVGVVALIGEETWIPLAFFPGVAAVMAASGFLGYGVADAWQERRSRGLPPRRRDGRGLASGRPGSTGRDPAPPGARTGRPAPACEPTGRDGTSGNLPGQARGRRAVSAPCRAPYNTSLAPEDIAYMVSRPRHTTIGELWIMPTEQLSPHRAAGPGSADRRG